MATLEHRLRNLRLRLQQPVLKDEMLYLGDNGRCYCGEHSGMSARYSGRDLSGQKVKAVTPAVASMALSMGVTLSCEEPSCNRNSAPTFEVDAPVKLD